MVVVTDMKQKERSPGGSETPAKQLEALRGYINPTPEEEAWFSLPGEKLPCIISPYYFSLINPDNPLDPIRLQAVAHIGEAEVKPYERRDPLGEAQRMPVPYLIHRYPSRAVFLASGRCAMYCRHCFRRSHSGTAAHPQREDIERASAYLASRREITELLISGGDPLVLPLGLLEMMLGTFRETRPDLVLRICTRVPVVRPDLVTRALAELVSRFRSGGLYIVTQFNHPAELTDQALQAAAMFIDRGMPVLNQSVLLKGVNDSVPILQELCTRLVGSRIIPFYLFHPDLAEGTARFRISIRRGLEIYAELRRRLSHIALPEYAVDMPGGGGKVPLAPGGIAAQEDSVYTLVNQWGEQYTYVDYGS
jgi:lysine 2,3-aminomutase